MKADDQPTMKYETLLMDMDGVLAEVSKSYRAAIEQTCHLYGATAVTQDTITQWKIRGNANDDWKLSRDLILDDPNGRKDITLEQVTETFERFYQGDGKTPGLCTLETLIPLKETLLELRRRSRPGVGIVTGRPRRDCLTFLQQHGLTDLVDATYCMEDGPSKPDPAPVRICCERLGVAPSSTVVLVGDTPDDIRAAVAAGCRAVGVLTPEGMAAAPQTTTTDQLRAAVLDAASPICVAMTEAGADVILEPGFAALVEMFVERP